MSKVKIVGGSYQNLSITIDGVEIPCMKADIHISNNAGIAVTGEGLPPLVAWQEPDGCWVRLCGPGERWAWGATPARAVGAALSAWAPHLASTSFPASASLEDVVERLRARVRGVTARPATGQRQPRS
jgi:hypothetical protein